MTKARLDFPRLIRRVPRAIAMYGIAQASARWTFTSCTSSGSHTAGSGLLLAAFSALQYLTIHPMAHHQSPQPVTSAVQQLQYQDRSLSMMTRVEMNQSFRRALVSEMNGCGERTPFLKPSVAAFSFCCKCRRQKSRQREPCGAGAGAGACGLV